MTGKKNKVKIHKVDHTQFGGIIFISDFNTDYRGKDNLNGSTIAKRIAYDQKFDKQCKADTLDNQKCWREQKNVKRNNETNM